MPVSPVSRLSDAPPAQLAAAVPVARMIGWVLLAIVLVRLGTLGAYALGSTTEPRYAEIARKMLETGNWVTPWFDHGVPFWGKPPLSFWGSAATMALFGVNEFGARLAPFLAAAGTAALFWAWPRRADMAAALPLGASVVMASSVVGFIASAAVMTDMFMAFSTTLCMVACWRALSDAAGDARVEGARSPWRWWFFVGLALGLLAKGPVATVITGLAIGLWAVWTGSLKALWRGLPWLRGLVLTAALALPWYLLAEQLTPGFLQYFIVGEHLQRFLVSGWTGDLYGQGHPVARGLIWWFAVGGFLPWSAVLALAVGLGWRQRSNSSSSRGLAGKPAQAAVAGPSVQAIFQPFEWQYLVAWTVSPLLFFTPARNILEAYVLPGLPAFALLTALCVLAVARAVPWLSRVWWLGLLCPLLWAGWLATSAQPELRSQRALLRQWPEAQPGQSAGPLVYLGERPLSANFYSAGQARVAPTPADIQRWLASREPATLVAEDKLLKALPPQDLAGWREVAHHAGYTMLHR